MKCKALPLKEFYAKLYAGQAESASKVGWYTIQAKAEGPVEVTIFDFIGAGGVSASDMVSALGELKGKNLQVRVNSPGGDVFDGIAIYNALRKHDGTVNVVVDGLAASAASLIAMSGEMITMSQGAMMMIHDAWAMTLGNADDHSAMADTLNKVSGELAGIYSERTGISSRGVRRLMLAETWLTAQEAKAQGFADVVEGESAQAQSREFFVPEGLMKTKPALREKAEIITEQEVEAQMQVAEDSISFVSCSKRLELAKRGEYSKI